MLVANIVVFVGLYLFINYRLNTIEKDLNTMISSFSLLKEEKKLKKVVISLFLVFFIISSIYILMYF
jgi:predicted nucleic acid-binding Zn ribbon protein